MQVIAEVAPLQEQILHWHREGQRIALISTMGHIHDGHISLVEKAKKHADVVVVSIFINPALFEKADNFSTYPRSLDQDIARLTNEGVDLVFNPSVETMYPNGIEQQSYIEVPVLGGMLEGVSRAWYLKGVTTQIVKLFNLIQPDVLCFSEKDYQQLAIIKKIVADLFWQVEIVTAPIARELDGLAMSNQNSLLTVDERQRVPVLSKTLRWVSSQIRGGRNDYSELVIDAQDQLRAAGLVADEIFIRDANTLLPVTDQSSKIVILATICIADVRLIDNMVVELATPVAVEVEEAQQASQ